MKKLTFLLALVFLSCLEGNAQNLILNPGFEICNGSNTGTCWAGTCIPNDRGQICIIPNWYAYINRNGYMLNNSIDFFILQIYSIKELIQIIVELLMGIINIDSEIIIFQLLEFLTIF